MLSTPYKDKFKDYMDHIKEGFICGVCGGTTTTPTGKTNVMGSGLDLVRCTGCGTKGYNGVIITLSDFANSVMSYKCADHSIGTGAANNDDLEKKVRFERTRAGYFKYLHQAALAQSGADCTPAFAGKVYDVGVNVGDYLAAAKEATPKAWVGGCEINARGAEIARGRGLAVEGCLFQDAQVPEGLDVVSMLDVIEHTHTPGADLAKIHKHLRPGGVLLVKTFYDEFHDTLPDLDLSSTAYGRPYPAHGYFDPISHVWHFDTEVLKSVIQRAGFKVASVTPDLVWGQVTIMGVKVELPRR